MSYEEETTDLRARIRELEAALEKARMQRNQLETHQTPYVLELQARAEKAEVAEASARFEWGSWEHRAQVAEARVAELADLLNRIFEHDGAVHLGPDLIIELRDIIPRPGFAREREAE